MDDTRDVTKDGQEDVDEEVCIAATLKEDTKRWEDDGKDDFADIAVDSASVLSRAEKPEGQAEDGGSTYEAVKAILDRFGACMRDANCK